MSPKKDLASIIADAEWLPAHWDAAGDAIQFAWVPRETHSRLTFLSDQYLREIQPPVASAAMSEVRAAGKPATAPNYIFHSAFCCSTLLTRALDVPGVVMGLSEPQIVNELATAALQRRLAGGVLNNVISLLGRPFAPGESVTIKPGNEANGLAPALLESDERSRAIFLYAPLPRFLASVANKGMWGRIWGRRLYSALSRRTGRDLGFSDAERFEFTDLQTSALAWLLHHAEGADLAARFPDRVRTLDSETFLAKRSDTLIAVARHFGLDADPKRWTEVAQGPVFESHSKEIGRGFSPEDSSEAKPVMPVVKEEIHMVTIWAQAVAQNAGLSVEMPRQTALLSAS